MSKFSKWVKKAVGKKNYEHVVKPLAPVIVKAVATTVCPELAPFVKMF